MPYRMKTLAGANAAALAEECRAELDAALTANPRYSKVTNGYTGNVNYNFIDVWRNDGTESGGYPWYVVVARATSVAYTLMGGALEYDPATFITKKALRGKGDVDAQGYPVTAPGSGIEGDFPLSSFAPSNTATSGNLSGKTSAPTSAVAGDWCRTLVTDEVVWQAYGNASTTTYTHGIGVYQNLHSTTMDLKPLSFIATMAGTHSCPGTVWKHPAATEPTYPYSADWSSSLAGFAPCAISQMAGDVGGTSATPDFQVPFGSRVGVFRKANSEFKSSATSGIDSRGGFLGLVSDDFLVFDRLITVLAGDTLSINGKLYASITTPGTVPGLFINTQPDS